MWLYGGTGNNLHTCKYVLLKYYIHAHGSFCDDQDKITHTLTHTHARTHVGC